MGSSAHDPDEGDRDALFSFRETKTSDRIFIDDDDDDDNDQEEPLNHK
jgi:hypothetical protein